MLFRSFQIGLSVKNGDMKFSIGFEAEEPLDILEEIDKAMNPPIDNRGV